MLVSKQNTYKTSAENERLSLKTDVLCKERANYTLKCQNAYLGNGLQVSLGLLLLNGTGALWLAVRASLGDGAFTATTAHGNAVDDIA